MDARGKECCVNTKETCLTQGLGGLEEAGRSQWGPCSQPPEKLAQALHLDRLNYGVSGSQVPVKGLQEHSCGALFSWLLTAY